MDQFVCSPCWYRGCAGSSYHAQRPSSGAKTHQLGAPSCVGLLKPDMTRPNMEHAFARVLPEEARRALFQDSRQIVKDKPDQCVRIGTYNLRIFSRFMGGAGPKGMVRAAEALDADILVLQEAPAAAKESFGHLYPFISLHLVGTYFGNAICSKWPLKDVEHVTYGTAKPGEEHRSYIVATVCLPSGRPPLRVVCTHLDVWDNSGGERRAQAEELATRFGSADSELDRNTMILGDFNALRRSNYDDRHWAWIEAQDQLRGVRQTPCTELHPLFSSGWRDAFGDHPPCITTWSLRRVDYALLHPEFGGGVVQQAVVCYDPASDHFPLAIDIQ